MKTNSLTRVHFVAYSIAFCCLISLFFVGRWEQQFHEGFKSNPFKFGSTLRDVLLFIINICLLIGITKDLNNVDERIEKIKNYVRVHVFFLLIFSVMMIGLFARLNSAMLMWIALVQIYYMVIFWICIYRDSSVMYMNEEKMKAYSIANDKKLKINYISAIITGGVIAMLGANNRFDLAPAWIFISTYSFFFIRSVTLHWN